MSDHTKMNGTLYQREMSCDVAGCTLPEMLYTTDHATYPERLDGWHVAIFDGGMHRDMCTDCFESMLDKFDHPPAPKDAKRQRVLVTQEMLDSGKDYGQSNGPAAILYPDGPVFTQSTVGTYQMLIVPETSS